MATMNQDEGIKGPIEALGHNDKAFRQFAAVVLGKIKDPRAVEPLIAALKDADSGVRGKAVVALGKIGDSRAVDPLITALKDADNSVRTKTADALVKMGPPAVDPLINTLRDPDSCVWERALEVLVRIGPPAVGSLTDIFKLLQREKGEVLTHTRVIEHENNELKVLLAFVESKADEMLAVVGPGLKDQRVEETVASVGSMLEVIPTPKAVSLQQG